jgi:hypothetical protein
MAELKVLEKIIEKWRARIEKLINAMRLRPKKRITHMV